MTKISMIGLDLAKNVFQVHGIDEFGNVVLRKQLRRSQVEAFFGKLPPVIVGIEACGSAHYWGRVLEKLGHEVRMMSPGLCEGLLEAQQDRRARRGSDLRGDEPTDDAVRASEEP